MTIRDVNAVANRLSLRPPQRTSLEILNRLCEIIDFEKSTDVAAALKTVHSEFPYVEDFERDFPSLCFALATGVGKTRLMGAFITYLYRAEGIRHFFVLAPNLTIYKKLIADFTPNTAKYVFQGIAEFTLSPPEIITGEDYESGRGVRNESARQTQLWDEAVHINIFNISKINSEVRGGNAPRIKRLSEYIGESYFAYLSKLDDLVLLMDESHRYRAQAGMQAINELKPILGLELTATPQIIKGQNVTPFKNVIYSYPLCDALNDGFVKAPAVATRENFNASNYDADALERLKLEDGIHIHEETKVQLEVFARDNGVKRVKPFVLVVAKDTTHASTLRSYLESSEFFNGQYKGKVAEVHSNQRGDEKDENIQRLLAVEDPSDPTEIVIHVDQLKEGWDVTNLYTIIPLRPFNSRTLIEQAIGRGLRLPYGKRVGVAAVDRLTIVSHDKFQDIIDEANRGDSILKIGLVLIGKDIPDKQSSAVVVPTKLEQTLLGSNIEGIPVEESSKVAQPLLFSSEPERQAVKATLEVVASYERKLKSSSELLTPAIQKEIADKVAEKCEGYKAALPGIEAVDYQKVVSTVCPTYVDMSIDVPKIIIVPSDDATYGFRDFDLQAPTGKLRPVSKDILIQNLQNNQRERLTKNSQTATEQKLEDYLVRELIDYEDISYDDHSELLYKLSRQMVSHLRSYLADDDEVLNVLVSHNRTLVDSIYSQLQEHYFEQATSYEVQVTQGFRTLHSSNVLAAADETMRHYRDYVEEKKLIRGMLFTGFKKCLYASQKFDSDTERRFSVIVEQDDEVIKWFKPGRKVFQIHWRSGIDEGDYEPDFVVETANAIYLCEPKARDQMNDAIIMAKKDAATTWCEHASKVSQKPWKYLLIPHDAVDESKSLEGLAASFEQLANIKSARI